ncbi:MAG: tetratricopeptide repeat protein [candidate division KSB1 bacterium]|nr:tetratricopeptide repeat protein [candidate division KSB1 bacterium]
MPLATCRVLVCVLAVQLLPLAALRAQTPDFPLKANKEESEPSAKTQAAFNPDQIIPYEDRLRFYLDLKTKDFLVEMADKEMILLQTIENVTAEVKQRGLDGIVNDDAGFNVVYQKTQTLTDSYTAELEAILAMIDEISALSGTLEKERQYGLLEKFQDLKARLVAALEDRKLYKKAPATPSHVAGLIKEYGGEVDSLLRIYHRLEKFRRLAEAKGDTAVLPLVERQKASLLRMVADLKSDTTRTPDLAEAFLKETEQVAALLLELDKLEKTATTSLETTIEVEAVRRNLVAKIDTRLLQLFGFYQYANTRKPSLDEVFHAWRGERLADYQARSAEYEVMKKRLLTTGGAKERRRMLERDLTNALLNYAAERYRVAELQFDAIIRDYDRYFSNWDAIKFYRAESFYARQLYPSAFESYEELLRSHPDSKFLGLTLLRLMTIAHTLKWEQPFFAYYHRLDSLAQAGGPNAVPSRVVERGRYLAGYYNLNLEKYSEAEAALSQIPPPSRYHFAAQYLRGIAQTHLGNLSAAFLHFQYVAETTSGFKEPITGLALANPTNTLIQNNAMMRLGFIYYQRGEFANAIRYFEKVSRGAENYDQALIGLSWAYLKQGDLQRTMAAAGSVLSNYLSSNYQYEAMVLSAHCQRLLNQPESALEEFRYVANAHGVLDLAKGYQDERAQILAQLGEVDRLEKTALEHQDRQLYAIIAEVRQTLFGMMNGFGFRSNTGARLIDNFSEERQSVYRQIQQLDRLVAEANAMGLIDVARDAIERRNRLVRVLETYQADRSIENVNYFIDYPLATKESSAAYRRQIVLNLFKEMEAEQNRLKENLAAANRLVSSPTAGRDLSVAIDLKAVQDDFKALKYRMDRFQTWLSTYKVDEVATQADLWADVSGFGMSDIAFRQLNQREQQINLYSQNLTSIDNILRDRKSTLEEMLKVFDKEMRKIEEDLLNEQVRLDKLEHETYFKKSYFDLSTSEIGVGTAPKSPTVEDILKDQIP